MGNRFDRLWPTRIISRGKRVGIYESGAKRSARATGERLQRPLELLDRKGCFEPRESVL